MTTLFSDMVDSTSSAISSSSALPSMRLSTVSIQDRSCSGRCSGYDSGGESEPFDHGLTCSSDDSFFSSPTTAASTDCFSRTTDDDEEEEEDACSSSRITAPCFRSLRYTYLSVILVVFLADGMQGTHLYTLYNSYGFSVASLYCLGFFTGGVLSPITGPWIDQMGRKRAAMLYCALEVLINTIEQYPNIYLLVASRVIGGLTTNLLHCVFETWLDCEFRKQKAQHLSKHKNNLDDTEAEMMQKAYQQGYELLMRDAVIISNSAAIGSGYISHLLAHMSGPVGPFRGAVVCTVAALAVVSCLWTENYGGNQEESFSSEDDDGNENDTQKQSSLFEFLKEAVSAFMADYRMLRVGIVQGFSVGSLQIFVFLWSPIMIDLAAHVPQEQLATTWGIDEQGEPAFGLIFMLFMSACVLGGVVAPWLRQAATCLLTPVVAFDASRRVPTEVAKGSVRPMAVEFLAASCYLLASCMLMVPCVASGPKGFSRTLWAFTLYEFVVGIACPCEGVIRSLYFPAHARASVWTLPSFLVNAAVSLAVFSTQFVSLMAVCSVIVGLMMIAAVLQISLITATEWATLKAHLQNTPRYARSLSFQIYESSKAPPRQLVRFLSQVRRQESSGSSSSVGNISDSEPPRVNATMKSAKDKKTD